MGVRFLSSKWFKPRSWVGDDFITLLTLCSILNVVPHDWIELPLFKLPNSLGRVIPVSNNTYSAA